MNDPVWSTLSQPMTGPIAQTAKLMDECWNQILKQSRPKTRKALMSNPPETKSVWRIEARKHAFAPWRTVKPWHTIETAPAECAVLKRRFHFYAVRVRPN